MVGEIVPIDGQTIRGSYDRSTGKSALHVISAWASVQRLVLAQMKVEDKSNEITAKKEDTCGLKRHGNNMTLLSQK